VNVGLVFLATVVWMLKSWIGDMRITAMDRAWGHAMNRYLLISGAILWFPETIPWNLRFLRYAGVLVHVACALIIIHVYMGTAMVRGGFTSIIRGEVSPAWAKMHHRLWYDGVTGKRTAGTAASTAPPSW
jgi:formate dehydrogenase subunit gamma